MSARRFPVLFALALLAGGCGDSLGPRPTAVQPPLAQSVATRLLSVLRQAKTAPRFAIPRNGLVAGANGACLKSGDSILVTLTIDPSSFLVDFQPSGVLFSKTSPATLGFWYGRANPDLNGDGVVDSTDRALIQQLAIWYQGAKTTGWSQQPSINDPTKQVVGTAVYHFSQYAVAW